MIGRDDGAREREARLTAYALGELDETERGEVEAWVARDAAARRAVEEARETAVWLRAGFAAETAQGLRPDQRRDIEATARRGRCARHPVRRWFLFTFAAAASALVAVGGVLLWQQRPLGGRGLSGAAATALPDGETGDARRFATGPVVATREPGDVIELDWDTAGGGGNTLDDLLGDGAAALTLSSVSVVGAQRLESLGYAVGAEQADVQGLIAGGEPFSTEAYDRIVENAFVPTARDPLSTFSIDVDTASYSNVRRFLERGELPPPDAVRIEELVNYFPYAYPRPEGDEPFSVALEVASCPWEPRHRLVRIALAGREIPREERRPANLVFLLDVSGSMDQPNKLPLVKRALGMLVQELGEADRVAIVVYAGASGLVLPPTPCSARTAILDALDRLDAGGSTNGAEGIELAYRTAEESFLEGGINRVILATDGDFNVGITDRGRLTRLIEEKARSGVFLSVLGFGMGNLKDATLEQLADRGNGHYAYIDSPLEARKVLVSELGATLETIAKDVKIQVEWNPLEVAGHRLIGYENRVLAHQDFTDDTKDAGEIGAGHTVTALYEIVPARVGLEVPGAGELRYQGERAPTGEAFSGELCLVKLRYKDPDGETSREIAAPLRDAGRSFFEASEDFRFAASVAAFGLLLRHSRFAGEATMEEVVRWATGSLGEDEGGYREQFVGLARRAAELLVEAGAKEAGEADSGR